LGGQLQPATTNHRPCSPAKIVNKKWKPLRESFKDNLLHEVARLPFLAVASSRVEAPSCSYSLKSRHDAAEKIKTFVIFTGYPDDDAHEAQDGEEAGVEGGGQEEEGGRQDLERALVEKGEGRLEEDGEQGGEESQYREGFADL
jgi:hypothetical protein